MISVNDNDYQDDNSESDEEPLGRSSMKAIGKGQSKDSFTSTHGKLVATTQSAPRSARLRHPAPQEVNISSAEEDQHEPAGLASKKVSD